MTDSDKIKLIKWKMQDILIADKRPVKNTTKKQCYEVLEYIQELLETNRMSFALIFE